MSNRNKIHSKGRIQGQWTAVRWEVLDSAAWKQMSMGARSLYIALIKPLSFTRDNNGKIFLSTRDAAKTLGASQHSVWIWFHELEHYGFTAMTEPGTIGPKGKATRWRITDAGWGKLDGRSIEPTKDYLKWDGVLFEHPTSKNRKTLNQMRQGDAPNASGADAPNASLPNPSDAPNASEGKPPNVAPNASYLGQPSPCASLRPGKPKPVWTTPVLTEMPYTAALRRLYAAEMAKAALSEAAV
jgi:hypothetical protein